MQALETHYLGDHNNSYEAGTRIIPILHIRTVKLRLLEVESMLVLF